VKSEEFFSFSFWFSLITVFNQPSSLSPHLSFIIYHLAPQGRIGHIGHSGQAYSETHGKTMAESTYMLERGFSRFLLKLFFSLYQSARKNEATLTSHLIYKQIKINYYYILKRI
jgi:hypothetical protein